MDEDLKRPLQLIKDVAGRLVRNEIPFSQGRLDTLYSHIAGATQEVLDYAQAQLEGALNQVEAATDRLRPELDEATEEALELIRLDFAQAREEIVGGLEEAKETFFGASNFTELQGRLGFLEHAQARIQAGLQGLEASLQRAQVPEGRPRASAPQLGPALQQLAQALMSLQAHLAEGQRQQLVEALRSLDEARAGVAAALEATR